MTMTMQAVGLWAECCQAAGLDMPCEAASVGILADALEAQGDDARADQLREIEPRAWALAVSLGVDVESVTRDSCQADCQSWVVGACVVQDGTSPERAAALVAGLRECLRVALQAAGVRRVWSQWHAGRWCRDIGTDVSRWRVADLRRAQAAWAKRGAVGTRAGLVDGGKAVAAVASYDALVGLMRSRPECAEMLRSWVHEVVNTLYFLADDRAGEGGAQAHQLTLREAFDGAAVIDRRTARQSAAGEYLVVSDDEANELWDADLESMLDDGGIVQGADSPYFDRERWKRDARQDGRAHSLGRYDGREDVADWDGETWYIYRTN